MSGVTSRIASREIGVRSPACKLQRIQLQLLTVQYQLEHSAAAFFISYLRVSPSSSLRLNYLAVTSGQICDLLSCPAYPITALTASIAVTMSTEEQTTQNTPSSDNATGAVQPQVNGNRDPPQANGESQGNRPHEGHDGHAGHAGRELQRARSDIKDKITDKKQKLKDKTAPPGGFDSTPLPDVPPGFTVKITFIRASNLPIADLRAHSADPFVHATLMTDVPNRHNEDPVLTYRTWTVKRSTEPEWNQEWVVANVPQTGFTLECRLFDEDDMDLDDRLGTVTIRVPHVDADWEGFGPDGKTFPVKKRKGSFRAYLLKAAMTAFSKTTSMTPFLTIGVDVLGPSEPPYAQMYTVGPTSWVRHFSPTIGRLAGVKVNKDEGHDADGPTADGRKSKETQKYE